MTDGATASSAPIVCLGAHVSALFVDVERVPREGETVRGTAISEPTDGGKSTCQAVAAARLGAPVAFVSVLGDDDRGRWWQAFLAGEGIDVTRLAIRPGATDTGVVLLPPSRAPAIVSVMSLSERLDIGVVREAADLIASASMVVCALECPHASVAEALGTARAAGVTTVLNPAPADGVDPSLVRLADYLIANEHEAAMLVGADGTLRELAEGLASRYPQSTVVVTGGAAGAVAAQHGKETIVVPAPDVTVVDTTGAGDAFLGALCAALARHEALADAVAFGVRVASTSVTRHGSIESYPTLLELTVPAGRPT